MGVNRVPAEILHGVRRAGRLVRLRTERLTIAQSLSAGSRPWPIPANECSVTPPMLQAAMPVGAVTTTASGRFSSRYFSLRSEMMRRRRKDLPVPAEPVKKTDLPSITTSRHTCVCSSVSESSAGAEAALLRFTLAFALAPLPAPTPAPAALDRWPVLALPAVTLESSVVAATGCCAEARAAAAAARVARRAADAAATDATARASSRSTAASNSSSAEGTGTVVSSGGGGGLDGGTYNAGGGTYAASCGRARFAPANCHSIIWGTTLSAPVCDTSSSPVEIAFVMAPSTASRECVRQLSKCVAGGAEAGGRGICAVNDGG